MTSLRDVLGRRVLVADGAMGTMLQAGDPTLDDFDGHDGCNEVLNVTRPDLVRSVHDAYLAVGVDCIETNTFGANLGNLGEYDISDRIAELAHAGAVIAREAADAASTAEHPRFVLGSVGPGTKLPSLGHAGYPQLRDAYEVQVEAMVAGGVDAVLVETAQDLLQAKAALAGARRAIAAGGRDVLVIAQVTVETTGTMLLGSEIGAALTALEPLGVDVIGLNCATGPAEMSEHLRHLSRHARVALSCMPNAGLPVLTSDGAHYPLGPVELADAHERFVRDYGLALVGGCCGTTPEHLRHVVERLDAVPVPSRDPQPEPGAASLYASVPTTWEQFARLVLTTQLGLVLLPILIMTAFLVRQPRQTLLWTRPPLGITLASLLLPVVLHPAFRTLGELVQWLYPPNPAAMHSLEPALATIGEAPWWQLILVLGLTPAICEELAFRGFILSGLRRLGNPWAAVGISSVLFGLTHGILQQSLTTMVMGCVLGYLALRTRSLLPAVLFHLTHNSLSVLADRAGPAWFGRIPLLGWWHPPDGSLGTGTAWAGAAASVLVGAILLAWLHRRTRQV